MTLGPGDLTPLSALTPLSPLLAGDLVPVLRTGNLQNTTAGGLQAFAVNSVKAYGAIGDGITDDTAAIVTAINSGMPFYFPPGVYSTSSTLSFHAVAAHGQVVRGAGPTASDGTGTNKAVIRPLASVSVAILIDGTPFGGYVQGFGLEDLTIDMVNMTDASTSVAVQQVQAFGCRYVNIKVRNDGVNKRSWQFLTGAYTTSLHNCKGNFVECIGTNTANGVTTISFYDFDGDQLSTTYTNSITVIGGAWQGVGTTKFKFRFGTDFWLKTDVEGSGVFLDTDNSVNALRTQCELQGFSGTYMINGPPAASSMLFDQQVNYNSYPFNLTVGTFQFNNQGVAANSSLLSGSGTSNYYLEIGRTSLDLLLGVAGATNDFVPGSASGDAVLGAWGSGSTLFLAGGSIPMAKVTSTGFTTFGNGTLRCGALAVNPASDGANVLLVKNAENIALIDITTSATAASSTVAFANGVDLLGYTDAFATQSWKINSASGIIQSGAQIYPGSGTSSAPVLTSAAGILAGNGAPSSAIGNNGDFYLRGDGSHGLTNLIWHKEAGAWVAII